LAGWTDRFAERHGALQVRLEPGAVVVLAADGASAAIEVPGPALLDSADPLAAAVARLNAEFVVGALLVRRGGFAVGIFEGARLVSSKVGRGYVQGKTKAGGWSQQRYARRRANQADQAYAEAAEVVAALLIPRVHDLASVVGGGDQAGVHAVLADRRLAELRPLLQPRVLPTPDPRLRVLAAFAEQFRAVRITLNDLA
jgi:hypothetical protein